MTPTTLAALGGLALVDSTSFGTLGIPLWLMLRPRVRVRTLLLFLATICTFYWALGLALTGGATVISDLGAGLTSIPHLPQAQLALGVGLFALSFTLDEKHTAQRRARREAARADGSPLPPSRRDRWKARLAEGDIPAGAVVTVALGAGLVEAASMLPYLGAVGLITQADPGAPATAGILAGYVLVMALPAVSLLGLRLVARRSVEPLLGRINAWFERNSAEMLSWVVGSVGLLLALDAVGWLQRGGVG
ncbi:GAP family protein [Mobilicoccus massiliensis]|uniref:GAP family protein n=1 Tax=Mobilicoccus massiliensis TaxID=1522310 RepID=UPI0005905ABA|nr:GAP family protein [Mobilicoccus massiliensis]